MTGNVTLTAKFSLLSTNCTVSATASPSEGGTVTGGGKYTTGKTATLKAVPNSGWKFTGWYKDGVKIASGAAFAFDVNLYGNVTLSARFERDVKLNVPQSATVGYKSTVP